jgi:hypothetical protein
MGMHHTSEHHDFQIQWNTSAKEQTVYKILVAMGIVQVLAFGSLAVLAWPDGGRAGFFAAFALMGFAFTLVFGYILKNAHTVTHNH